MHKNPYLAHYFGDVLDSSREEEEKVSAAENFAYFPHSSHIIQRVFCPSKKSGLANKSSSMPLCTPPSNVAHSVQIPPVMSQDRIPTSPPGRTMLSGSGKGLSPVSLSTSQRSTPVDGSHRHLRLSQNDVPALRPESPVSCIKENLLPATPLVVRRDDSLWDAMISQSHAVIAHAKEILSTEESRPVPCIISDTSDRMAEVGGESCAQDSPVARNGVSDAVRGMKETTPVTHLAAASKIEEGENFVPSPVSSRMLYCSLECTHPNSTELQQQQEEQQQQQQQQQQEQCEKEQERQPVSFDAIETRCLVLTMNPNAVACAAKRLTRRRWNAPTAQKSHGAVVVAEEQMRAQQAVAPIMAAAAAAEQPVSRSKDSGRRSKSKGKSHKDGVISVASLYGILDRLAGVVHSCHDGTGGGDSAKHKRKKLSLDASKDWQQGSDVSTHIEHEGGMSLEKRTERKQPASVPVPQVLVGNAPRINPNGTLVNSHRYALNATVPTSQLPQVGIGLRGTLSQRTPSTRRSSVGRAPKTPGYAMPTECWLCKGADLGDVHAEAESIIDGAKRKAAPI